MLLTINFILIANYYFIKSIAIYNYMSLWQHIFKKRHYDMKNMYNFVNNNFLLFL